MTTKLLIKWAGIAAVIGALQAPLFARDDGKVGKMEPADFRKTTEKAGEKIAALLTVDAPLSAVDRALIGELALVGLAQLQASELAATKARATEVKLIAEEEAKEQNAIAAKLKEVATRKSLTLPTELDDQGKELLEKLEAIGDGFDRLYLQEVGVRGHEELKKTMTKVQLQATDPTLKSLAAMILPLIEIHITVAQDEMATLG
ncbi:DUF4142 domain-containing protein [Luteolibacter flavescens]|uniref:DUF4142 domain-containing protein n=1 Tax=Luteolibacter flavescens TaxID=1859460 RepID=A0ABT3FPI7_9BACT|nr:DUF4142 domain-containing protein [Luteolibacter flavescens]MCW1885474.1 DUF4142 domain-containing protein [Luteolibacter flavescens]